MNNAFPQESRNELRRLWLTGLSQRDIAAALDCSRDTVDKYARRMNLPKKARAKQKKFVSTWSEQDANIVKDLWGEVSTSLIAERIGHGCTKNAVISKAHRMGLAALQKGYARGISKVQRVRTAKEPRRHRGRAGSPAALMLDRIKNPPKLKVIPVEIPPPEALMITFMQLNEHTCKWPLGESTGAAQLYCGAAKAFEVSYCRHHFRIAYKPVTPASVRDAARNAARMAA